MWNFLKGIAGLLIIGFVVHYFWTNGVKVGVAKAVAVEPEDRVRLGKQLLEMNKADEGLPLLEEQSSRGNLAATEVLARAYQRGTGVPKDPRKAFELYKVLSEKGDHIASYAIGVMYYCGEFGERDVQSARLWFRQAASGGYEPAVKDLQAIYRHEDMKCAGQSSN
jgi:TPR repeat protein